MLLLVPSFRPPRVLAVSKAKEGAIRSTRVAESRCSLGFNRVRSPSRTQATAATACMKSPVSSAHTGVINSNVSHCSQLARHQRRLPPPAAEAAAAAAAGDMAQLDKIAALPEAHLIMQAGQIEQQLLNHVLSVLPDAPADPSAVLNAIDTFAWGSSDFYMNVGDVKGLILDDVITRQQPGLVLELGAYCGYSAVRIARLLPAGARLLSVDIDQSHVAVARAMVRHAGLDEKVEFLTGTLEGVIPMLKEKGMGSSRPFDVVFVDHIKEGYLPDMKLMLQHILLGKGSVVVADNIVYPGAPDYLEFVQTSGLFDNVCHETRVEYRDIPDLVTVSTFRGSS